jgi:aminopeptidase N
MYRNAPLYLDKREAILFAYKEENELDLAKELLIDAMMDDSDEIKSLAISKYDKFDEVEDLKLKSILLSVMKNEQSSMLRGDAVEALTDYYLWAEGVSQDFENQINKDSSYYVIGQLIIGIAIADSNLGMQYAEKFEKEKSIEVQSACAEVYAAFGNESNFSFFDDYYNISESYEVMSFISYYQDYLMLIDNPVLQKKGLSYFEQEANSELAWYIRYYAVSGMVNLKEYYHSMANSNSKSGNSSKAAEYEGLVTYIDSVLIKLKTKEEDPRVFMER